MMEAQYLTPDQWSQIEKSAVGASFGHWDEGMGAPLSYALLMVDAQNTPRGYVTAQLHGPRTVYWKFGAALFPTQGSIVVRNALLQLIDREKLMGRTKIHTFIENTNTRMLRMALSVGFRVVGVRLSESAVLVDHCLVIP